MTLSCYNVPQWVKTITFKSLLRLSVGHSQVKMTKITGTFKCRHGESQSPNWGTKTQSFSPFVGGWAPLPRQSSFWQRMEPAETMGLYHSPGQAFLSFSFSFPFTVFCFPWRREKKKKKASLPPPLPPSTFESNMKLIQVMHDTTKWSSWKRQSQEQPSRRPDA